MTEKLIFLARRASHLSREEFLRRYLDEQGGEDVAVPQPAAVQPAYWYECPRQYRAAGDDRKAIYSLVAAHLKLADTLLARADPERRRVGLGIGTGDADPF
ncbi:MAG: hypothetical protein IIB19_05755, partial [Chloroflexi bacterium]|nr:hypothetical protein [Chloroflexota bacterium]